MQVWLTWARRPLLPTTIPCTCLCSALRYKMRTANDVDIQLLILNFHARSCVDRNCCQPFVSTDKATQITCRWANLCAVSTCWCHLMHCRPRCWRDWTIRHRTRNRRPRFCCCTSIWSARLTVSVSVRWVVGFSFCPFQMILRWPTSTVVCWLRGRRVRKLMFFLADRGVFFSFFFFLLFAGRHLWEWGACPSCIDDLPCVSGL